MVQSPSSIVHPSLTAYPAYRVAGGWSQSQLTLGGRRGTPWTGRQSIAGSDIDKQPLTLTFTPKDNLETPINLACMSLDGGRKPEHPERTHADTGRTCKLHIERPPSHGDTVVGLYIFAITNISGLLGGLVAQLVQQVVALKQLQIWSLSS